MPRGKKSSAAKPLGVIVLAVIALVAAIPREGWIAIGAVAGLGVGGYVLFVWLRDRKASQAKAAVSDGPVFRSTDNIALPVRRQPATTKPIARPTAVDDALSAALAPPRKPQVNSLSLGLPVRPPAHTQMPATPPSKARETSRPPVAAAPPREAAPTEFRLPPASNGFGNTRKPQVNPPSLGLPVRPPARTQVPATPPTQAREASRPPAPAVPPREPAPTEFRVPPAPKGFGSASWIAAGQAIGVAGVTVPGGMVYVGTRLKTPLNDNDPCLIDPSKAVAARGDYTQSDMGYWPSYSGISATARRAYLNWLADGRRDPQADVGYVFLFFYGLERRAIIDAADDRDAQAEMALIAREVRRLLDIYGERSHSFRRYAGELLDWISLVERPAQLYNNAVPSLPKNIELPLYMRVALGQAAVDGVPVPAHLALAWAKLDPTAYLRTPATRCEEQFDRLFLLKYEQAFGEGIVLPRNRTKLKFVYQAASAGFRGYEELRLTFGDIPDVTALTAPIKKLQQVVEAATTELEPFSRYVGKNPEAKSALEGLLQLPATLWPQAAQHALNSLKDRMGGGMVAMSFQDLLSSLDAKSMLTKEKTRALARALESMNIGIEPDVLGGAKLPKPDERVVLFTVPPGEAISRSTPTYQAAALTLQLASAVAVADGEFNVKEMGHLRQQVQSWTHLTPNHIRRLLAHLRLLVTAPASLASLKKKLDPLDSAAKETIAAFMATVAQSDGAVSPDEVKMLEKVYKALGVEPKKVFSDVHAVSARAGHAATSVAKVGETGFKLDPARIAALQQDSEKVSALLANIFKEVEAPAAPMADVELESEAEPPKGILGLDEAHSALARMLLSRPEWTRDELLDVAADMDLMLDGALERINEASFDIHDIPLTEGHDPIEVRAEVLEKITA